MEIKRKPFQGVFNIVRFNWHFYVVACIVVILLFGFHHKMPIQVQSIVIGISFIILLTSIISLVVSYYVYDISGIYKLDWLPNFGNQKVLNINAGFDETSLMIKHRYPNSELKICDFYNPEKHTEVSVKRARKAYPPHQDTIKVTTDNLPFEDNYFDYSLAIFSAHEIRDIKERVQFFNELRRVTKPSGHIYVTEHLRDFNNFLAYTLGFLHFHSQTNWHSVFNSTKLMIVNEIKITPFVSLFKLKINGTTN
jgi:SAM-dependent methyltransferase